MKSILLTKIQKYRRNYYRIFRGKKYKFKCKACGNDCDGTLPKPFMGIKMGLANRLNFVLCRNCFDKELAASKPLMRGNSYTLIPKDAA